MGQVKELRNAHRVRAADRLTVAFFKRGSLNAPRLFSSNQLVEATSY